MTEEANRVAVCSVNYAKKRPSEQAKLKTGANSQKKTGDAKVMGWNCTVALDPLADDRGDAGWNGGQQISDLISRTFARMAPILTVCKSGSVDINSRPKARATWAMGGHDNRTCSRGQQQVIQ